MVRVATELTTRTRGSTSMLHRRTQSAVELAGEVSAGELRPRLRQAGRERVLTAANASNPPAEC
jgi:hypothetical protein